MCLEALDKFREAGDRPGEAGAVILIAETHYAGGKHDKASYCLVLSCLTLSYRTRLYHIKHSILLYSILFYSSLFYSTLFDYVILCYVMLHSTMGAFLIMARAALRLFSRPGRGDCQGGH